MYYGLKIVILVHGTRGQQVATNLKYQGKRHKCRSQAIIPGDRVQGKANVSGRCELVHKCDGLWKFIVIKRQSERRKYGVNQKSTIISKGSKWGGGMGCGIKPRTLTQQIADGTDFDYAWFVKVFVLQIRTFPLNPLICHRRVLINCSLATSHRVMKLALSLFM